MKLKDTLWEYEEPVILTFNGVFWKGFRTMRECYQFLSYYDPRSFFAVSLETWTPF